MGPEISFECTVCGHNIVIDESTPPKPDAFLTCHGCGHEFGEFTAIRDALVVEARARNADTVSLALGKTATWAP